MNEKKRPLSLPFALIASALLTISGLAVPAAPAPIRAAAAHCPPLPPPAGPTVAVSTEAALRDQAQNAAPGTTILVAPGTYNLQDAVYAAVNNLTIRGATGRRDDVILDGGGMLAWSYTHIIDILANDVTIADLTLRNGDEHGVSVQGSDRPILYNLRIIDTGYQLVKVNPVGDGSEDGLLACSRLEYTATSPEDYTNGISAHNAHRWTVRDNEWVRIRTPNNAPAPTILFWSGSSDTIVERNLLVDCYQGIAFGNASHGPGDHTGGVVRNNFIYASLPHDSVIEMVHADGWLVAHNTALLLNPDGVSWGMEARFADSAGTFAYNLTNMGIWLDRDGANGSGVGNVTNAESGWFVNAAAADLHLNSSAAAVIDQAAPLTAVTDDYDGDSRPAGRAPDIGADEYTPPFVPTHFIHLPYISAAAAPQKSTFPIPNSQSIIHRSLPMNKKNRLLTLIITLAAALSCQVAPEARPASQAASPPVLAEETAVTETAVTAPSLQQSPAAPTATVHLPLVVTPAGDALPGNLIQPADLTYHGAFVYPEGDDWAYSGHALAHYPGGDPGGPADGHPGSLYAAAHTWYDLVGELTIPAPVISTDFAALPRAAALRSPADITGGRKDNCAYNDECEYREVDGLAYLPNVDKIAWNLNDWYNVGGYDQDSVGWSDLDMSGAQGVWHIGGRPSNDNLFHNNRTSNYLFPAPQNFADAHLDGKWLIAGKHREAGAFGGSQGPTLYALAPWEDGSPPAAGQNLDALALLYYPEIEACVNDPAACRFPNYRPADNWGGGAWMQTADASAILITGRKGLGDNCYGTAEACGGDPCSIDKGYHAYPYQPQILFYDPAEIEAALAGSKEPWEILPYATYAPTDRMFGGECATLGAAAYDRERGLLYAAEQQAGPDGETVIHVWQTDG